MRTRLATLRDTLGTQFWPIPTIAVMIALLLGLSLPKLDGVVNEHLSGGLSDWLFGGDADAARSLLGTIASSLITVTALTFSLTVVTPGAVPRDLHLRADRPAGDPGRR